MIEGCCCCSESAGGWNENGDSPVIGEDGPSLEKPDPIGPSVYEGMDSSVPKPPNPNLGGPG